MNKIKLLKRENGSTYIDCNGYYYIDNNTLIYKYNDGSEVEISDLTELRVWEYQNLVKQIKLLYPDYNIDYLIGKFI
jgi:hypothetical protein